MCASKGSLLLFQKSGLSSSVLEAAPPLLSALLSSLQGMTHPPPAWCAVGHHVPRNNGLDWSLRCPAGRTSGGRWGSERSWVLAKRQFLRAPWLGLEAGVLVTADCVFTWCVW